MRALGRRRTTRAAAVRVLTAAVLAVAAAGVALAAAPGAQAADAAIALVDTNVWTDTHGQAHLVGVVRNDGAPVESIHTTLTLLDAGGASVGTVPVYVLSDVLGTGSERPFEAVVTKPPAGFADKFSVAPFDALPASGPDESPYAKVTVTAVDKVHATADALEGTVTNTSSQDLVGIEVGAGFTDASGHLLWVAYAPAENSEGRVDVAAGQTANWSLPWIDGAPHFDSMIVAAETTLAQQADPAQGAAVAGTTTQYPVPQLTHAPTTKAPATVGQAGLSAAPARTLAPSVVPSVVQPGKPVATTILSAPAADGKAPAGALGHDLGTAGIGIVVAVVLLLLLRRAVRPLLASLRGR